MKIVQVLTFVSEDNAYGGPTAVARIQCQALASRGHEVHLIAGWDGKAILDIPGVEVHLSPVHKLPGLGFAGFLSPGVLRSLRALAVDADAVHLHYARDLVQLPAAWAVRTHPGLFLQAHGMVRQDARLLARALDRFFVRSAYRRANTHLALTDAEVVDIPAIAEADVPIARVRNAVEIPEERANWHGINKPVVLFSARLHARKRPVEFVRMAAQLMSLGVSASYRIFGPDAGEARSVLAEIKRLGLDQHVEYRGPLAADEVTPELLRAQVYVLPSVNEPFPMSLLEAMAAGVPSVITDQTGLSHELSQRGSALVTDGSPADMAEKVQYLLTEEAAWVRSADAARKDAMDSFSASAMAAALEGHYQHREEDPK